MSTPAWLTSLVDQRLAMVEHALGKEKLHRTMIATPLVEPPEGSTRAQFQRYERTCDNPGCQAYCPHPVPFFTGIIVRELRNGQPVYMSYGVCLSCKNQLES